MSVIALKQDGKVRILPSQHTPDYEGKDCLVNPKLPDCPVKYMDIVNGEVVEMSEEDKAAVDSAIKAEIERQLTIGEI